MMLDNLMKVLVNNHSITLWTLNITTAYSRKMLKEASAFLKMTLDLDQNVRGLNKWRRECGKSMSVPRWYNFNRFEIKSTVKDNYQKEKIASVKESMGVP